MLRCVVSSVYRRLSVGDQHPVQNGGKAPPQVVYANHNLNLIKSNRDSLCNTILQIQ